jgi:hypothetical protein
MKILIGCEESQTICKAFREKGYEAYSCDLKPCSGGHPEWHLQMDVFKAIAMRGWGMAIFNPDCTYITVTANKWLKDQPARESGALVGAERREARDQAIRFVEALWLCDIPVKVIENPVGCLSTRSILGKPTQIVQPYEYGHPEPKKTCLWISGLPNLVPTQIVEPEYHTTESGKRLPRWYAYADKSKGQAHRAEIRSKTFPGIAKAMAEQWGDYLTLQSWLNS